MGKKKWDKPELIVLVRGKPEERVLSACKTTMVAGPGPLFSAWCQTNGGVVIICDTWCAASAPS